MMNILITGGLGYVGGRLAAFLKEKTSAGVILTTMKGNYPSWTKDFKVLPMDLKNEESIKECLKDASANVVIHLAALDKKGCEEDHSKAVDINVNGTERLLRNAEKTGVERFIYFSTVQVYGTLEGDIREGNPVNPQNIYSKTKSEAEGLVAASRSHRMKALILRLSNAYGYPQDLGIADHVWGLVFNSFCKQVMQNGTMTIQSNQYRDFIAMEDVARAVYHFLFVRTDEWQDGLFNLGGGCPLSVLDVAHKISGIYQKQYGKGPVRIEGPLEAQDHPSQPFKYNIDKLRRTGFELKEDMETEVTRTLMMVNSKEIVRG